MTVQGIDIALTTINDEDYISLTDIIKAKKHARIPWCVGVYVQP